ncbi:EcsC family protein [Dehalobacter sp. DCM]|uniref:EcsC family protein n=1 Tax=Dehalobacter sp. DCM TaxID=2907827 RepID=UPI003081AA5E|nr:EcsC family protein [Dehalobacter sp. DCM]
MERSETINPSKYENQAIKEIHAWKNPKRTWSDKVMEVINWPIEKVGQQVNNIPGIETVINKSVGGTISLLNDFAQWSVRSEAIFEEYRKNGCNNIQCHKDIFNEDLSKVDNTIGFLAAKYKALAVLEGTVAGAAVSASEVIGGPGGSATAILAIPGDVIALLTLSLRAIGEYATYYGFNASSQQERLFILNILAYSSSPSDVSKEVAMAQLVKLAQDVAKKKAWRELDKSIFTQIIKQVSQSLGKRLTKAKLAEIIPVAGVIVGGGFNAYFMNKICEAAYYLYRERFLAEKYGVNVIEVTVKPAESYNLNYLE